MTNSDIRKRIISAVLMLVMLVGMLPGYAFADTVDSNTVKINYTESSSSSASGGGTAIITVGGTATLAGTATLTGRSHEFTSSNTDVATVTHNKETGTVTGVGVGTATITHKYHPATSLTSKTETFYITVLPRIYNKDFTTTFGSGESFTIENKDGASIAATGYDSSVVSFSDGKFTPVGAGVTSYTAAASKNGQVNYASGTITVSPTVSANDITVKEGKTLSSFYSVSPSDCDVTFSIADSSVAAVESGVLYAKSAGTTTLTVTASKNGASASATCNINVEANVKDINVSGGEWDDGKLLLYYTGSAALTFTTECYDGDGKKDYPVSGQIISGGEYVSFDGSTNTVSANGTKPDGADAYATLRLTAGNFTKDIDIVVRSIAFTPVADSTMVAGNGTKKASIYCTGLDSEKYENIKWYSSDSSVLSIDDSGTITARKAGTAEIYATLTYLGTEYTTDTKTITVTSNVKEIVYTQWNNESLGENETSEYTAEIAEGITVGGIVADVRKNNSLSTVSNLTWSSSNESVATVDGTEGGRASVTAVAKGTTDIVAEAEGKQAVAHVTVVSNIEEINLPASASMRRGENIYIFKEDATSALGNTEYVDPMGRKIDKDQAEGGYVTSYRSNDENVVKVNSNGTITALAKGRAVLTVTVDGITNSVVITVAQSLVAFSTVESEYKLDKTESNPSPTFNLLDEVRITYIDNEGVQHGDTHYSEYSDIEITWTSLNTDIATVDENGIVTAVKPGHATISATADGRYLEVLITVCDNGKEPNYTDGNTYTVTINYIFGTGSKKHLELAEEPFVATFTEGQSVSINKQSPVVQGYYPSDDYCTVNVAGLTSSIERTVYYNPSQVTFTVNHYLETAKSGVYESEPVYSQTVTGNTEESVELYITKFDNKSYANYYKLPYNKTQTIAADGSTSVDIRYNRNSYLVKFILDGGTGVDCLYDLFGSTYSVSTPVKEGYTFKGWRDAEGNVTTFSSITIPTEELTYTAVWEAAQTSYTVVYWLENANDTNYSYGFNETLYGLSDTVTAADFVSSSDSRIAHYKQHTGISQQTIKGDGTTVVNVYYDRESYTLTMKYDYKNKKYGSTGTIEAKWGSNIGNQWADFNTKANNCLWRADENKETYTEYLDIMPSENRTYYMRADSSSSNYYAYYYCQGLDGNYPSEPTKTMTFHNNLSITDEDRFPFDGFTYDHGSSNGSSLSGAKFYYARNTYELHYYTSGKVDLLTSENVKYGADLSEYNKTPEKTGYIFKGWYLDEYYQREFDFSTTMPSHNVLLYAKFEPIQVMLTVVSKHAATQTHTFTLSRGQTLAEAAAGGKLGNDTNPSNWCVVPSGSNEAFKGWL